MQIAGMIFQTRSSCCSEPILILKGTFTHSIIEKERHKAYNQSNVK
ncbi:hypothetical protein ACTQWG_05400 [Blautia sp. HCP3S3_H10_1]